MFSFNSFKMSNLTRVIVSRYVKFSQGMFPFYPFVKSLSRQYKILKKLIMTKVENKSVPYLQIKGFARTI